MDIKEIENQIEMCHNRTVYEFFEELEKHLKEVHPEVELGDWAENMVNHKLAHNF